MSLHRASQGFTGPHRASAYFARKQYRPDNVAKVTVSPSTTTAAPTPSASSTATPLSLTTTPATPATPGRCGSASEPRKPSGTVTFCISSKVCASYDQELATTWSPRSIVCAEDAPMRRSTAESTPNSITLLCVADGRSPAMRWYSQAPIPPPNMMWLSDPAVVPDGAAESGQFSCSVPGQCVQLVNQNLKK